MKHILPNQQPKLKSFTNNLLRETFKPNILRVVNKFKVKLLLCFLLIGLLSVPAFINAQCTYLNETFSNALTLSPTQTSGAWYPDRYAPAGFASTAGALNISISASDGAQLRLPAYSSTFYNTQGRKLDQCGTCVQTIKADLYVPSDWATKMRRTDMWGTAFDGSNAVSDYAIIGFANVDGASPSLRYWDGSGSGVWVNFPGLIYDTWLTLEESVTPTTITYKLNGSIVGTISASGPVYIGNVIMQAYNFNDNTLGVSYDNNPATNSYVATWDNLKTSGTNTATLSGLTNTASASPICYGSGVTFTANGLVNSTSDFSYTITRINPTMTPITGTAPGVPVSGGSFTFPSAGSPYLPGTYTVTINSITVGGCTTNFSSNNTTTFTVNPLPTATAGGSQTICSNGTATVSGATAPVGTILWTHNGTGSLSNATTLTPTYTAAAGDEGNTVTLTMTVSNPPCTNATATYSVIVNKLPNDASGGFTSSSYCLSDGLKFTFDPINATYDGLTPYSIVISDGTNNYTIPITSNASTVYTIPSPLAPLTTAGAHTLSLVSITNSQCTRTSGFGDASASITTVLSASTADAYTGGVNYPTTCMALGLESYTLAANTPAVGTGAWSITAGPNLSSAQFGTISSPTSTFSPTLSGTYTLRWTISNPPCTATFDEATIQINAKPTGTIAGASNTQICAGQPASVNITLTGGNPPPSFNGVFNIAVLSGSGTTGSYSFVSTTTGASAVSVPAAKLPNTSAGNVVYRISWTSLSDNNSCTAIAAQLTGVVDITVNPIPVITVNAAPTADVCPGTSVSFTPTVNAVGGVFNWVANDGTSDIASDFNVPYGTTITKNFGYTCPINKTVTFTFTPVGPSSLNCAGAAVTRVVNFRDLVPPSIGTNTFPVGNSTGQCLSGVPLATANATIAALYTDNCSSVTVTNDGGVTTGDNCSGWTVTYTYTVQDACGNIVMPKPTIVYSGKDVTAPSIGTNTFPVGNSTGQCLSGVPLATANATIAALYTDNCSSVTVTNDGGVTTGDNCSGWTVTYTYTIQDACGNTVMPKPTIVYSGKDVTAPSIGTNTFPVGNSTGQCLSGVPLATANATIAALYTDNCSSVTVTNDGGVTTGDNCSGWTVTYTYTIQDACGNTVMPKPTIVYSGKDVTAPSIGTNTFPVGNSTGQCLSGVPLATANATIAALYTDNCSSVTVTNDGGVTTGDNCSGWTVTYTYTIQDACGNTVMPKPTIVYSGKDVTAPSIGTNTFPVGNSTGQCLSGVPLATANATIAALYTDNCSSVTVTNDGGVTTGDNCSGWTVTYTYTIQDACGNTVMPKPTIVYSGKDVTAPSIGTNTFPVGNSTGQCLSGVPLATANATIAALYTDNCSSVTVTNDGGVTTGDNCSGWTVTYTYTIQDACGNTVMPKPTIVYSGKDVTAPSIGTNTFPVGNSTGQCLSGVPLATANATIAALYTDNCSSVTVTNDGGVTTGDNCSGWTVTYTYTIQDACGNTVMPKPTIVYSGKDVTAPSIGTNTFPVGNSTGQCLSGVPLATANATIAALYTDNCSSVTVTNDGGVTTGDNCSGWTVTYTYTIQDACGNTVMPKPTIVYSGKDVTAPSIGTNTFPVGNSTGQCLSGVPLATANATIAALYTDNCSSVTVTNDGGVTTGDNCSGWTVTYTYTIQDACGNTVMPKPTIVYSGKDVTAPSIGTNTFPVGNSTGQCLSGVPLATANATIAALYTDNCSSVTVTNDGGVTTGDNCSGWTVTYTYTIQDACGNTVMPKPTIVYSGKDVTAPSIGTNTFPVGNSTGQCLSGVPLATANATIAALYTDNCSSVTVTNDGGVTTGDNCSGWTVTYTYTIQDACGNTVTPSPTIVYSGKDVTAPSIGTNTFPVGNSTGQCLSGVPLATANATIAALYTDNCSSVTVTNDGGVTTGDNCSGWTVTYTYTIQDACGNTVMPKPTIVYSGKDVTAPSIGTNTFPVGNSTGQCLSGVPLATANATIAALYTDNCSSVTVTNDGGVTTGDNCSGWTVTYTYTIQDACGNTVMPKPTIVYSGKDVTAPSIGTNTFPVGNSTGQCLSGVPLATANATIAALYTDNCSSVTVTNDGGVTTGDNCSGWTVTYTYTIQDACGNTVMPKPTIVYSGKDVTAPSIGTNTFPVGNSTGQCLSGVPLATANATIAALYTDNCSSVTVTNDGGVTTGDNCSGWTVTYTYTIQDACGNTVMPKPTIVYSGKDVTAPSIGTNTFPVGNSTGQCLSGVPLATANATIAALYTDNCSSVTVTNDGGVTTGDNCSGWTVTYTYTIQDACGNTVTPSPTIVYSGKDVTAPSIGTNTFPVGNSTGQCLSGVPLATANATIAALYTDNCSSVTVTNDGGVTTGDNCSGWTVTYTYTIQDACGNTVMPKPTIVYSGKDVTPPVLTCPTPATSYITDPGVCTKTLSFLATATDNCSTATVVYKVGSSVITFPYAFSIGSTLVNVTATDACGNSTPCSFTVVVTAEVATMATPANETACSGNLFNPTDYTSTTVGVIYDWTNNNTSIGLAASGSGQLPNFVATNTSNFLPNTATIRVTPRTSCTGSAGAVKIYTITVNPGASGAITGATNTTICVGETSNVNINLTGLPNFTGQLVLTPNNAYGTSSTVNFIKGSGAQLVPIPASSLTNTNTGTTPVTYTVTWGALSNSGSTCSDPTQLLGNVQITVNAMPVVSISGASTVITGNTTTLTGTPAGGVWASSNTSIATVSSSGVVTGVSAGGPVNITYTVSNGGACTATATQAVTVNTSSGSPDITLSILGGSSTFTSGGSSIANINVFNAGNANTSAPVVVNIPKVTGFSYTYNPTFSNSTINNNEWVMTDLGTFIRFTSNFTGPTPYILATTGVKRFQIGINATGVSGNTANLQASAAAGTGGGETPSSNNTAIRTITIN